MPKLTCEHKQIELTEQQRQEEIRKIMSNRQKNLANDFYNIFAAVKDAESRAEFKNDRFMNLDLLLPISLLMEDPRKPYAWLEEYSKNQFFNSKNDNAKGRITPIAHLASIGNHEAVQFLIEQGSQPDHALVGYHVGGWFENEEMVRELLAAISNQKTREYFVSNIQEVVAFNVEDLLPRSSRSFGK